jgi:formate/nitrite transporter FocA (FNT family)
MIILTGSTLVTGEMCLFSMAVMKRRIPIWSLPYNIVVAFFGNLFGSLWVAGIFGYYSGIFSGPYARKFFPLSIIHRFILTSPTIF